MEKVQIEGQYITLGQLLKHQSLIDTGGQAKWFLTEKEVLVNGIRETRRGKKLYDGDMVQIEGERTFIIAVKD